MDGNRRKELYRWKRGDKGTGNKAKFDYDNVDHWIKRVEEASEFAVSEVFSLKKQTSRNQRPKAPVLDLESIDQLVDHDDAYTEAQDLLSEWLSNKLKDELASDEEDMDPAALTAQKQPTPEFVKYNRFEDLYTYLEQETESTTTQEFLQQLLQKEVVDSGILDGLRSDCSKDKRRQEDPRLTMELRHQQVKENRAKRQQELENQRKERAARKEALSQAQLLVQEENKRKSLKAKREEEEIQREVVKLRKEMNECKKVMEEARKLEWKRLQNSTKPQDRIQSLSLNEQEQVENRKKMEKQARIKELLGQVYAENRRCLQAHFSIWYKMVVDGRVKMGKARALSDWKRQLRAFRAWRDYAWSSKVERETQKMEVNLRDQNRKQTLAQETYRKRILHRCLVEWQLWSRAEKEKRELEAQKEKTKKKMAALLDAASALGSPKESQNYNCPFPISLQVDRDCITTQECAPSPSVLSKIDPSEPPKAPRHAWQVTREHAALTPEELNQHRAQSANTSHVHPPGGSKKKVPPFGDNFQNRHHFQQQLIEEQRRQLQEQKEMILGLMENQRLIICKQEAMNATALTAQLSKPPPRPMAPHSTGSDITTARSPRYRQQVTVFTSCRDSSPPQSTVSSARRPPGFLANGHPAVRAMEERAAQRAERRKEMEELKRKREQERLAQLRRRKRSVCGKEAAEKEAILERKREERRLQKQERARKD
ncbi:hypothetical protein GDO86_002621 [Hymenochirus boettgeri]|uniref:Coiled-coil domain containing 191 n=1 Tax=Hymenochirus boettgeri TaxID=247094 RepID=A0A8T2K145_9PIPI|nr:hypothetical protein GDO86_002621 [Hymenochirus boettgeri]